MREGLQEDGTVRFGCGQSGAQGTGPELEGALGASRGGWYSSLKMRCHPGVTEGRREAEPQDTPVLSSVEWKQ